MMEGLETSSDNDSMPGEKIRTRFDDDRPDFRFGRAAIDTDFDELTLVPPWDVKRAPHLLDLLQSRTRLAPCSRRSASKRISVIAVTQNR